MNPLFKNFYKALQQEQRKADLIRQAGKFVRGVKSGRGGFNDLKAVRRGFRDVSKAVKTGDKLAYGRVSQFVKDTLFNELMRQLGPLGSIVRALIRPSARAVTPDINRELEAAYDLLTQFGYQVTAPVDRTGSESGLSTPPTAPSQQTLPPRAAEPMQTPGETVEPRVPAGEGVQGNFVVKVVGGRRYRIRTDDPILTGKMIQVKSSNVHSIGYMWNDKNPEKGTLQVRFLDKRKGRGAGRAGAGYQYLEVPPEVFIAFTKAASKGKFVWDKLRIRGTVSGHRFRYQISTLASDGYVPRKARLESGGYIISPSGRHPAVGEKFARRTVKGTDGKVYQSALPDRNVGNASPNRGTPNRGTPNRGR